MNLPSTLPKIDLKSLFLELYNAGTEEEVELLVRKHSDIFDDSSNWHPLGGIENNYGVIENQQSSPIASLIEKITNSIDAILMKKCLEAGISPSSKEAPKTMELAIKEFFPNSSNWNLSTFKKEQAEDLQILADGTRMNTSLIIYDNGEGQHPKDFEDTFLSILKGNKNRISFVQGKYNMGGTGAIVFCGKKRYQLFGSRRFDETGDFGFTLIRRHPLTEVEKETTKNTWYEYLKIDEKIPSFKSGELNLGLHKRQFTTGSIIKLYSYDLPKGARSVISRDLNQSINEFLFEPALPVYTIDKEERYPDDRNLQRELYGLKRRLEGNQSKYIESFFSENEKDDVFGETKITCYVFKPKLDGKSVKESRASIQREFFKNGMSVLFSMNGQVHGHYTSEFITRTLKMPLLKYHLLIHVDCTKMRQEFRTELFMASRDRLKSGDETRMLRDKISKILSKSRLAKIHKTRRQSLSVEGNTGDLLKSFTKNMPKSNELFKLLGKTLKINVSGIDLSAKPQAHKAKKTSQKKELETFNPKRFPTAFKLQNRKNGDTPVIKMPLGGEKTIRFNTDVEDNYFDRIEEPGDLKIALLNFQSEPNDTDGGDAPGNPKQIEDVVNVRKSSPNQGNIKVVMAPKNNVNVGDRFQVKISLENPGEDLEEIFWVKITEKNPESKKHKKEDEITPDNLGLPNYQLVYEQKKESHFAWNELEEKGISMDINTIMHPMVADDNETLDCIYINMDSGILKKYKSKFNSNNQLEVADKKFITSVYFHTLFLYAISKKQQYRFMKGDNDIDLSEYLKDLFQSFYSEFLLNFGMVELMDNLGE